jgi:enoyl-CoA hydratase
MADQRQMIRLDHEGHVAILTLNRASVRNAMNRVMVQEIAAAFREIASRDEIHVVLLHGDGPAFCSGLDTREPYPGDLRELYPHTSTDRDAPALCRKPIIAAVCGAAFGAGFELALMCDILIADHTAKFALPEITRETLPGFGGTQRLARLIGRFRAMEMCLTGRQVSAEEALSIGLVNKVVEPSNLLTEARAIATTIAAASPLASAMIKESINAADESSLSEGLRLERRLSQMSLAARGWEQKK